MEQAEIGLIGLAVMGSNLALNIAEKGNRIAVFNRTPEKTDTFMADAGPLAARIVPSKTLEDFVASIRPPRPVIIMVKAGEPVDELIATLRNYLSEGDIIIDAGNANFRDTIRRFEGLKDSGLTARHGPSIMVGGTEASYKRVEKVLTSISAKFKGEDCVAWLGENGAGHFVKTIHNGIEYADMQMIAEIYGILRDGLGLSAKECSDIFGKWNKGRLESYLIDIS
jgi:6-phosphogluconate dehydrogenase